MSGYIRRVAIFVPHGDIAEANVLAAEMDPDTGGHLTFGDDCCFSASGDDPATFCGCSAMMTQTSIDSLPAMMEQIAGSAYYLIKDKENPDDISFDEACTNMGLVRIENAT